MVMVSLNLLGQRGSCSKNHQVQKFFKPEFIGRYIEVNYEDMTSVVRAFMGIFQQRVYTRREVRLITMFLKRKKLTRAERHAVILHLGFHYSSPKTSNVLAHLMIDGYCDRKIGKKHLPSLDDKGMEK